MSGISSVRGADTLVCSVETHLVLARALIARGDSAAASALLAATPSPEGKALPIAAMLRFRIASCLASGESSRRVEVCRRMDAQAAEVSRLGLVAFEKETRLARESIVKSTALNAR